MSKITKKRYLKNVYLGCICVFFSKLRTRTFLTHPQKMRPLWIFAIYRNIHISAFSTGFLEIKISLLFNNLNVNTFVVKFVLIAIYRSAHQVNENVSKMVSCRSLWENHVHTFFDCSCPTGPLGGNSDNNPNTYSWDFLTPGSLDGNFDNNFITFSLDLLPRKTARREFW